MLTGRNARYRETMTLVLEANRTAHGKRTHRQNFDLNDDDDDDDDDDNNNNNNNNNTKNKLLLDQQ